MNKSEWIALGALLVSLIGLIPQFKQAFSISKTDKKKKSKKYKKVNIEDSISNINLESKNEEKEEMSPMMRILLLVIFAFASFLIEIIFFSGIASIMGVDVNLSTMTIVWKIIFYSLFLIPGTFLFLAFLAFIANTED